MSRIIGTLLMMVAAPACLAQVRVQSPAPEEVLRPALLEEHTLPYQGPGTVDVLDNGIVSVNVGRAEGFVDENGEWNSGPVGEVVSFRVDPAKVRLVEQDSRFFLDRQGAQLQAQGIAPGTVHIAPFHDRDAAAAVGRYSVLSITGEVQLDYDRTDGTVTLSIDGVSQLGADDESAEDQAFELHAVAVRPPEPAEAGAGAGADSYASAGIDLRPAQGSSRSVSCGGGASCSITCAVGMSAESFCSGFTPMCHCNKKPALDVRIE